jgi:hypothetical protein
MILCASDERNEWPTTTKERCHWCLGPITCQPPWPLPVSYDQQSHQYRCLGFFCCANCSEAARQERRIGDERHLQLIARDYYGVKRVTAIQPAAPREYLAVLYGRYQNWEQVYCEYHSRDFVVSRYPSPGLFVRVTYFLEKKAVGPTAAQAQTAQTVDKSNRGCMEQQKRVLKRKEPSAAQNAVFDLRSIFGGKAP